MINRKTAPILIFGVASIATIATFPLMVSAYQQRQARVERVTQLQINLEQAQLEQELASERKSLAEQRYKDGCLFIMSNDSVYVSLSADQVISDRFTRMPLPDETTVCDYLGNTAVTVDGRPTNFAFTGDSELVSESLDLANKSLNIATFQLSGEISHDQ